jgi:hypothetical protein
MGLGKGPTKQHRGNQRRRNKQQHRTFFAAQRRKERERQMSRYDIERNKELLKETFKRLNGFYRSKVEEK